MRETANGSDVFFIFQGGGQKHMKMRKRSCSLLALALAFAMVLGLLCSCGTASAANPPATTAVAAEPSETQNDVAPPEAELAGHVVEGTDENQDAEYEWESPDERDDDGGGESKGDGEDEPQMDAPGAHGYRYKVGDTVIYTEHDLDQWIEENDLYYPDHSETFHVEEMFEELFGCMVKRGTDTSVDFFKDGEAVGGFELSTPHPNDKAVFQTASLSLRGPDGGNYRTEVTIFRCGSELDDLYCALRDNYIAGIPREIAPLILLAAETMAQDPQNGALDAYGEALGSNFVVH